MFKRKSVYDVITSAQKGQTEQKEARKGTGILLPLICCLVPLAFLGVFRVLRSDRALMNTIILSVTTPIKRNLSALCARLPFNVAELVWTIGVLAVVVFLLRTIWLLITRPGRLGRLVRRTLAGISAALIVYSGYTFMWGINYYGDTLSERSGIVTRGCTTEELHTLMCVLGDYAVRISEHLPRNAAGEVDLDAAELLTYSKESFATTQLEFPFLAGEVTNARPMFYSKVMTWMGFTGFLFPFTGESLVNVDQIPALVPVTALHELAHQCSVAGEDEANFAAIVAGFHCNHYAYAYSSALFGYIHVSNALYSADRALWEDARTHLNDTVRADLQRNNDFWAKHDTPVEHTTKKVYDGFLKSYEQTDGVESYGKCVDLLVAYYFDLHPDKMETGLL